MKKIFCLLPVMMLCVAMVGCQTNEESLDEKVKLLQTEIVELESQRDSLKSEVGRIKDETGNAKYIITFNIRQTHITLDLSQHLKDEMNDITIQIPVDKEYFDSVNEGDVVDNSFRIGSLICKGSWGNWKVTIEKKEIL